MFINSKKMDYISALRTSQHSWRDSVFRDMWPNETITDAVSSICYRTVVIDNQIIKFQVLILFNFDRLEWGSLMSIMSKFAFGRDFYQWIKIL